MVTSSIPKFILAFVTIILGVVLTTVIAAQTNTATSQTYVTNEALDISGARQVPNNINTSWNFTLLNAGLADAGGWVTNSVAITNASGTSLAGNYTVDYTNDRIRFLNNTYMVSGGGAGNATLVTYQYYPTSYLNSQFGRDTLTLIAGFFAIALLMVGVALFYSIAKEYKLV